MAVSAARSATVTGSKKSPPLWSIVKAVRKCGKMTAPALSAIAWAVARKAGKSESKSFDTLRALNAFPLESQGVRKNGRFCWDPTGTALLDRDSYAPLSRKCRPTVIATLLFVRRNDILLQRGMALQVIPLPSLGVSSLDLGRSFNRTALFLSFLGLTIRRLRAGWRGSKCRRSAHAPCLRDRRAAGQISPISRSSIHPCRAHG